MSATVVGVMQMHRAVHEGRLQEVYVLVIFLWPYAIHYLHQTEWWH